MVQAADKEIGIRSLGLVGIKALPSLYIHNPVNAETYPEVALTRRMEEGPGENVLGLHAPIRWISH